MSSDFKNWSAEDVENHNRRVARGKKHETLHPPAQPAQSQPTLRHEPLVQVEIPQARPADVHAGLAGSGGDHSRTDRLRQIFEEERIDAERAPQFVLITDHRLKLIDPDNLNIKSLLDCLRYAKKIPDDSADDIRVLVRQRKVARVEETGTEIEVI